MPRPKSGKRSIEASLRDLILVPTEVVAELMEVGQPDLIAIAGLVELGIIPDIFQEKQDLGRQGRPLGEFTPMLMADKHPEEVRFAALGHKRGIGVRLVADGDVFRHRSHGGRKAALGGDHHLLGHDEELGKIHGRTAPWGKPGRE